MIFCRGSPRLPAFGNFKASGALPCIAELWRRRLVDQVGQRILFRLPSEEQI